MVVSLFYLDIVHKNACFIILANGEYYIGKKEINV